MQLKVFNMTPQGLQVMHGIMHVPLADLLVMQMGGTDLLPNALEVPVK